MPKHRWKEETSFPLWQRLANAYGLRSQPVRGSECARYFFRPSEEDVFNRFIRDVEKLKLDFDAYDVRDSEGRKVRQVVIRKNVKFRQLRREK